MPGQNYHDSKTVNYVCPFFQSEKGNCINCEGFLPHTTNKTSFNRKLALEKYREAFCFSFRYPSCHWAEVLFRRKYPSELE